MRIQEAVLSEAQHDDVVGNLARILNGGGTSGRCYQRDSRWSAESAAESGGYGALYD